MTTFNGWLLVNVPNDPPAAATFDYTATEAVSVNTSPFNFSQQIQDWQQGYLEASVSLPPLTHTQAQAWIAFLLGLRGQANIFQLGDPLAVAPQGSGAGTPLVNGANQVGYTLATKGWTANANGVLLPGDFLQIGMRLYRVMFSAVNADASGNATMSIWPPLRESPNDGDALILTNTQGLWRLKANTRKWSIATARTYGVQFDIREAI